MQQTVTLDSCFTPGLLSGSLVIMSCTIRLSSGFKCNVMLGSGSLFQRSCHSCTPLGKFISVANSSNVIQTLKLSKAFVNLPARTSGARYQSPSIHKKNALCIPYSLIKSPLCTSLAIFTAYSLLSSMDLTILSLRENK